MLAVIGVMATNMMIGDPIAAPVPINYTDVKLPNITIQTPLPPLSSQTTADRNTRNTFYNEFKASNIMAVTDPSQANVISVNPTTGTPNDASRTPIYWAVQNDWARKTFLKQPFVKLQAYTNLDGYKLSTEFNKSYDLNKIVKYKQTLATLIDVPNAQTMTEANLDAAINNAAASTAPKVTVNIGQNALDLLLKAGADLSKKSDVAVIVNGMPVQQPTSIVDQVKKGLFGGVTPNFIGKESLNYVCRHIGLSPITPSPFSPNVRMANIGECKQHFDCATTPVVAATGLPIKDCAVLYAYAKCPTAICTTTQGKDLSAGYDTCVAAKAAVTAAQTTLTNATASLTAAQAALVTATYTLTQKNAAIAAAQTAKNNAQTALTAANSALTAANCAIYNQ